MRCKLTLVLAALVHLSALWCAADASEIRNAVEKHEKDVERIKAELEILDTRLQLVEARLNSRCVGDTPQTAVLSCEDIKLRRVCSDQSGYYWITDGDGRPVQVYCEMAGENCCNSNGVFMLITNVDLTRPDHECPVDWEEIDSPKRVCGRTEGTKGCSLWTFTTHGVPYSKVCGRVVGYQYGSVRGFAGSIDKSIEEAYLHGISITYGRDPRNHIWSFAATSNFDDGSCPCGGESADIPSFVGSDYFCDSASHPNEPAETLYSEHRLWSGRCKEDAHACCSYNSPPIFCKELPVVTTEDIEVRLCGDDDHKGDSPIELLQIYIQ